MNASHFLGDCKDILPSIPDNSVQLIVTSPPYADARKKSYDSVPISEYIPWFLERSAEFQRVLAPQGTFILNIKERVVNGERSTYVLELILEMRRQGWLWTEEWIWDKKTCNPGKWPNRFRDVWERLLQFNLDRHFSMYQEEVMRPIKDWATSRLTHLSEKDRTRQSSATGSGFGKNVSKWLDRPKDDQGRLLVYPDNILHLSSETGNKKHSATFPVTIPDFFVKLFSKAGDTVLDPFEGSGTTGVAAVSLGRNYIGIDTNETFILEASSRINRILS